MEKQRTYFCIDMKSFYASVECAERGLNPLETNLVVADESRGRGALCLAVSPSLKALGVKNRCRLLDIPPNIPKIVAKPRMKKYIDCCADIYEIYLKYISPDDIHVYSVDESFIDATDYLKLYRKEPKEFAKFLMEEIAVQKHIPATAGIGTNLYLAKVALDITAKKVSDHIGLLTEQTYRDTLWEHRPITDFWQVARGTAERLAKYYIYDMKGITVAPEALMYKTFGINAELLIDHAWGRESCTMAEIKNYKGKSKSISTNQILFEDYTYEKALIVLSEMALSCCQEMLRKKVITNNIGIGVGYSKDTAHYTGKSMKLAAATNSFAVINGYVKRMYEETTLKNVPIRRLGISFNGICGEQCQGYTFFTDFDALQKEKKAEQAVLDIKDKFGKNAILRGADLQEGATQKMRNTLIGGHNGDDE